VLAVALAVGGHRHERLQQLIHEELDSLVREELLDPRAAGVRVVSVALSIDYRSVRAGFITDDESPAAVQRAERALARAVPFLRARLAEAVGMKRTPDLRFVHDAVAAGERRARQILDEKKG